MITVDYTLLNRQIRLLAEKLSHVEIKKHEQAFVDGLFNLLNSIQHEQPFTEVVDDNTKTRG